MSDALIATINNPMLVYAGCDNRTDYGGPWRPSIHMPRSASRLTLVVTATKIEPVQSINGLDALAEGITRVEGEAPWRTFKHLWESLHGYEGWDHNPDVVALTFTVHRCNIDRMKEAA